MKTWIQELAASCSVTGELDPEQCQRLFSLDGTKWQSFRTKKDRSLELATPYHECKAGRYKIAVKVVDIFGNDTMKIIDVNVEGK